ncbi:AMP-dependent synthetase/ligase [Shewanella marina]|uniref:AMP-dependent synthetase/ligase n=1 Tax=Shewanella marina TaxID=487319 RepID=UPI0004701518|nr:long-chain fatty acid--CoA ligase [Shewanella marina]
MSHSLQKSHFIPLFRQQVKARGDREATRYQIGHKWHSLNWFQLGDKVDVLAKSLIRLGVDVQGTVGIFAQNSLEWALTDIATLTIRGIVVPIYPTNTAEQAAYIVNDAAVKILFIGGQEQYDKAIQMADICPTLTDLVLMHDKIEVHSKRLTCHKFSDLMAASEPELQLVLQQRVKQATIDDLFTLIYTSGTTGEPKGVMLDHKNLASVIHEHDVAVGVKPGELSLSFLPLSHIYERGWSLYVYSQGGCNAYLADPKKIQTALTDIKPNYLCSVPRFYEKVYMGVTHKVAQASMFKKMMFAWAMRQGRRQFNAAQHNRKRAWISRGLYHLADKLVLSKLRAVLGDNFRFMASGGARMEPRVNKFFQYIGIPVLSGYGATETSATVSCNRLDDIDFASVGVPLPGLKVRIGDNDEVLVKGDNVMRGYYNQPEQTEAAFIDGWYRTGDAGFIDKRGHLHITDRIKELMKTSNGKYISPQRVEGLIAIEPMLEQVAIIADDRHFVTALLVPNFELLIPWAKQQGINTHDLNKLVHDPKVRAYYQASLDKNQESLANFEKVKIFTILPRAFSMDHGEITPTLKLRRKVINQVFACEIDNMYGITTKKRR